MKKLLALLLVLALVFCFAACGESDNSTNDTDDTQSNINSTTDDTESVDSDVIIDLGDDTSSIGDGPVVSGTPRPLPGN